MSDHSLPTTRWTPRPIQARLIRLAALVAPIVASIVFVALVSEVFPAPLESFWLYLAWWVVITGAATLVLVAVDRVARRLLPLAVLFKLSLVFPDRAPSRFRAALSSRTVGTLEERVAAAKAGQVGATPVEAAEELLALVGALDTHDPLTRGHSDRVRAYAQMIAEEMSLTSEEVDLLNWAALLHDIGKLDVPTEILAKEGRPSDEEWAILRRHPEFGEQFVAPLRSWLGEWADAVCQHHERWDGTGYPNGLSGDEIGLAGRIVAVADVFDVITSARSYKRASDSLAGREEIARCAGAQFDPRVVRAFLAISLGRLRFAMGPLSWLSHAPFLGRLPLTPAIGTVSSALAVAAAALTTGIVAPPPPERAFAAIRPDAPSNIAVAVDEDTDIVVRLPGATSAVGVRIVLGPSAGSAGVLSDGRVRYSPPRDFAGVASFVYEVCDARNGCRRATVRVVVRPVNDAPLARDDVLTVAEDAPVSVDVLANDTDPDGDPVSVATATAVSAGSATIDGGGRVKLVLPDGFNGRVTFAYAVTDGNGGHARANGTVFVAARNDQPVAVSDTARTPVGVPVRVMVLENDGDPDGDPVWVLRASAPSKGGTHNDGTGVTYTPPPGFQGVAQFTYTISDPKYEQASARVEVAVGAANLVPRLVDDEARVAAGSSVAVDVLANDHDPDGDALHVAGIAAPETGAARIEDGRIRYTAPAGSHGDATFSYTATDPAGASDKATVHVHIDKVEQPEQPTAPAKPPPSPPSPTLPSPTPDPPAEPVPAPTPAPPPPGPNSAPSFSAGPNKTVLEDGGSQTVAGWATSISAGPPADGGQTVTFQTTDTNAALFSAAGRPAVASDGTLTFTPAPDASGTATVTLTAVDNGGTGSGGANTSAPQTFTITVTPVNDVPAFATGGNPIVVEDAGPQSIPGWASSISPGPADESSQSVTFAVLNSNNLLFTAGGQPTVAGNGMLTFASAPNVAGTAVVSVRAVDNGGTANGGFDTSPIQTFTIQVTAQPDPPVAADDTPSVNEDDTAGVTFDVLANDSDPDGDPLTLAAFDGTTIADGQLIDNGGGSFTYVPNSAFSGSETFTYTAADGNGGVDSGTVTITVTPQPDNPVAGTDAYVTGQATVLTVNAPGLLANDYDEDGDPLTVITSLVLAPTNGLAILLADGSFVYTPNPLFVGTDTFVYRIDDGTGRTADGLVTITVDSTISSTTLYLQPTGPSADVWDISTSVPAAASPVPDHDNDGDPGLTIKSSGGNENESDARKRQLWRYPLGSALQLNGPVTLQLWSTSKQFKTDKDGHPHLYLYDCTAGGITCVKIAETDEHVDDWNGSTAGWVYHEFTIGSVNRSIAAGRELRVRLLMEHEDFWVALTAAYPSALQITTG